MKRLSILILAALFSSTSIAQCYTDEDKFSGIKQEWCGVWGTEGKMLGSLMGVDPIPYKITTANGGGRYFIRLNYESDQHDDTGWLFIAQGESLVFLLDGKERLALSTKDGSLQNRTTSLEEIGGATVHEYALYQVTLKNIKQLAAANTADFAVYGERGRVERSMGQSQIEYYKEFLEKYGE